MGLLGMKRNPTVSCQDIRPEYAYQKVYSQRVYLYPVYMPMNPSFLIILEIA